VRFTLRSISLGSLPNQRIIAVRCGLPRISSARPFRRGAARSFHASHAPLPSHAPRALTSRRALQVVHRDIKAANILVDDRGTIKARVGALGSGKERGRGAWLL
jgi:serine/threonine protein kinase